MQTENVANLAPRPDPVLGREPKNGQIINLTTHAGAHDRGKVLLTFRAIASEETPAVSLVTPADQRVWLPGQALHVPVRTIHRFEALEDSVLLEVSTPDLTDVVRLQDDFSRPARD